MIKQVIGTCMMMALTLTGMAIQAQPPAVEKLTVSEGFVNPIGFYDATPAFSWLLPQDGSVKSQSAYQVVAGTSADRLPDHADLWDSGRVESAQSVLVSYEGKELSSRQRVYWQVKFWDEQGRASGWSEVSFFELGLLSNADWQGQWIRMADAAKVNPATVVIEIDKAMYGAAGDAGRQIDIRPQLKELIGKGTFTFVMNNAFAGADPAQSTVKNLALEYRLNGERVEKTIREGDTCDLASATVQEPHYVPVYLRRKFSVPGAIKAARLYVTAKGLFEVHLNGGRVGKDYMAPGWTPYDTRIETLTYDVTDMVRRGENAIGAIVGEGWYAGELMSRGSRYPEVKPEVLMQLEILGEDGQRQVIATDASWKASNDGPIRFSGIYDGEIYDARKEIPGWSGAPFDDAGWKGVHVESVGDVALVPKRHSPVRVTESLAAQAFTEPESGRYVFDLGQNMVGWPELSIPVRAGETITVRVAEMLKQDGTLYTENYRSADSTDYYTGAKDGIVTWHPTFTFHGFRYVELSGFPEGTKPETSWVTGKVLHSDFAQSGRFNSSHAKLNQLYRNVTWGQRGNYLDIPTDCPQRNERLGWTGDAQVFCATSLFNYDVHAFWASWLQSVREEQGEDGLIPHVVPNILSGKGSPGWGDVGVVSPWDVFVRTGDLGLLEDNYDMMRRWTAAYAREAREFLVDRRGYQDWLQPYPKNQDTRRADTPQDLIATAYFGRCAGIMQQAALALGRTQEAELYGKQFKSIRAAFSKKFFDATGKLTTPIPTQTGYLMALGFDLLEPELREGAVKNLLALVEEAGGHLRTGFLGTPLITFVLDDTGHTGTAYEVLFKETYPSWFYSINQGATTMWERWNSYSHEDGFGEVSMNSFNHYAYGAIEQWMVERIAGLAPDPEQPGYRHFFVQPRPGGPLTSAEAEYETPYGTARSAWHMTDEGLVIEATVPPNTMATAVLPKLDEGVKDILLDGQSMDEMLDGDLNIDVKLGLAPGRHTIQILKKGINHEG